MLAGKIALVTGASRGIGSAIAKTLAGYGATVVINYNGSKERAEAVAAEIAAAGGSAMVYQADVSKEEEAAAMFADVIKQYGRLDILVNNAGITRDNLILKMTTEDFDAVIDTNLKGVFQCMKLVSKQMLKQKAGRIINISSISGVIGNADRQITVQQRQALSV